MTIVGTLSVGGDLLENATTLSQDDISLALSQDEISLSCPMPATLQLSLPDLSKEGGAAWI
jgi:hypothetical protein